MGPSAGRRRHYLLKTGKTCDRATCGTVRAGQWGFADCSTLRSGPSSGKPLSIDLPAVIFSHPGTKKSPF